jgi:NADH-quinone oxidoreductase subunit M
MHGSELSFPILTTLILLPAGGAIASLFVTRRRAEFVKLIAAITSVATGAMSVWLTVEFDRHDAGFQFASKHAWVDQWGIGWHLGVDGISL